MSQSWAKVPLWSSFPALNFIISGQEMELTKYKVLNHVGYFTEQKTGLQMWGSAVCSFHHHTLGEPQGTRHCTS